MKSLFALIIVVVLSPGALAQSLTQPSADGVEIFSDSAGDGEPVIVLVHGWCTDGSYWNAQIADLSRDYQVVTIDLAGHGSSGAKRKVYTMAAFGADVVAVLAARDLNQVILVGHSMGGAVITEAALAAPDRVIGLIGVDNFQEVNMALGEQQIAGFVSTFERDFVNFTNQWVRSMFHAEADSALVAEIAGDMASAPVEVGLSAMEELLAWYGGLAPARLQELTVPLMCINADKQPTNVAAMIDILPEFEVRYLPGTGHFLFREDPANFNKLLRESIAAIAAQ